MQVCLERGCTTLTEDTRCEAHQRRARVHQRRFQQGATAYNSPRWVRTSTRFRAQHPFCIYAQTDPLCTLVTEVTDHIRPHRGDPVLFWDPTNWQPMCHSCHSRKTQRELQA